MSDEQAQCCGNREQDMSAQRDYWAECLACAADEIGLAFSAEHLAHMATALEGAHENYVMAFYSPPPSDRLNEIAREWKAKLSRLQADFDEFRNNAETAVKVALRQRPETNISIGEYGEVRRHDGRSDRIQ